MEHNTSSRVRHLLPLHGVTNYCKGIAYQLTEADPLIDADQCKLDAASMQTLGANAIRVYHVDPNGDHTGCMSAFADAGIYLFVDLETFNTAIDPVSFSPGTSTDSN
jgi:1,3-beta-glucanosyltransferase GAS1